jgi:hypothetical protein
MRRTIRYVAGIKFHARSSSRGKQRIPTRMANDHQPLNGADLTIIVRSVGGALEGPSCGNDFIAHGDA